MVSGSEPQVFGFSPILFNMYPTGGRVAVPGVCGKRRSERKVLGYARSLKPRRGCWPSHLHKGQKPWVVVAAGAFP